MDLTPKRALANHIMDGNLDEFVETRRANGRSWARISLDIRDATEINITAESLRNWYEHLPKPTAAAS